MTSHAAPRYLEMHYLAAMGCEKAELEPVPEGERASDGSVWRMTHEHHLIAQKPA